MASLDATNSSAAARQRGNDFYRRAQFTEAEKAYKEAAQLAPEDPAPWSNISAIKFEQGNYPAALKNLEKALELSASEPDHGPKKQKLYTRMAKCHLHSLSIGDAERATHALVDDESGNALRLALKDTQKLWSAVPDEASHRKLTLDRLPRYKGHLQDVPEYYATGHDEAESLMDKELQAEIAARGGDLAFLFCGSGDARHLYRTIIELFACESMPNRAGSKKFGKAHITIVDLNATALARTLVMFDMLITYAIMKFQRLPRLEDALTVMAYTFCSAIIPPFVLTKMMESVKTLIGDLEKDKDLPGSVVLGMFYLPKETGKQVLRKLKQWTEPLGDGYATEKIRAPIVAMYLQTQERMQDAVGKARPSTGCQQDFRQVGVLLAQRPFLERREPELIPLLDAFRAGRADLAARESLGRHIDANWKINPTVLDMDYLLRRQSEVEPGAHLWERLPVLDWNPVDIVDYMAGPPGAVNGADGALQNLGQVFDLVAISSISLNKRIQIEVIAGEMADVMERIRYNSLEHRSRKPQDPKSSIDPTRFPREYDRIHMSNIPDYVGGALDLPPVRRASSPYRPSLQPSVQQPPQPSHV